MIFTVSSLHVLYVDYSMLLSIVDESLTDPLAKLKCMLFARELRSLPNASVGDVIRLHRLKVNSCVAIVAVFLAVFYKQYNLVHRLVIMTITDYIMYPGAAHPIYFLSDREDSHAYHLKWQKLWLV